MPSDPQARLVQGQLRWGHFEPRIGTYSLHPWVTQQRLQMKVVCGLDRPMDRSCSAKGRALKRSDRGSAKFVTVFRKGIEAQTRQHIWDLVSSLAFLCARARKIEGTQNAKTHQFTLR